MEVLKALVSEPLGQTIMLHAIVFFHFGHERTYCEVLA